MLAAANFAGDTLLEFGELVRQIATDAFDPDGSPPLLVAWRRGDPVAMVAEVPGQYFQSAEAKDELGMLFAALGASGVTTVALITEGWYALPGTPAFEEYERSGRSLQEIREAGIEGVGENLTAWLGDAEAQAAWIAEIERDASGARLGRWTLWGETASRWHAWFQVGAEYTERQGPPRLRSPETLL